MSTQALTVVGPTAVVAADTYVSSAVALVTKASLPDIDDGTGTSVAVGTEIRFECTGGAPMILLSDDGRFIGMVPGRGAAVAVAEAGAQESETDFWRFQVLPTAPAAHNATPAAADCWAVLVGAGFIKAE